MKTHLLDLNRIFSIAAFAACWVVLTTRAVEAQEDRMSVAGYLPDYRFYIDLNQTALFLDDLYLFSVQVDPSLGEKMLQGCCLGQDHLVKAKQANAYKLQVTGRPLAQWLTIGGGGRSEGFQALNSREKYQQFLHSVGMMTMEYDITGIDFDHEALRKRDDMVQYFRLVTTLAPSLRKMGLAVSMAIHAGFSLPARVHEAVDRINVMTYDLPSFASIAEVKHAMESLLEAGIPSHKLFLGIPAYGRHEKEVGRVMTFAEMVDTAGTHGLERMKGPWSEFRYDGPSTVRQKVQWAKQKKLGGVFFWELGQDKQIHQHPGGVLLETAKDEASKHSPPPSSSDEL